MPNPEIRSLPIAVRVYPQQLFGEMVSRSNTFWMEPPGILVIHTVARRDARQKLLIGSYQFIESDRCREEGLFYGDLSSAESRRLKKYTAQHFANTDSRARRLRVITQREFLKLLYELVYKARCLVVGFNLPLHLSRLAFDSAPARGFFAGGFSFGLWTYTDKKGRERPNKFRPRICVKYIDRKRSLIGFTARNSPDQEDLIPEGSRSGEPKPGYRFPGHFLDLRTLGFALADEVFSLESACAAFGVELGHQGAS